MKQTSRSKLIRHCQNSTMIREIIYKYGPISRAEIASLLDLTMPTITSNVNNFLEEGIVYEKEIEPSGEKKLLGRKPTLLVFDMDVFSVIGIELGFLSTTVSVTNLQGQLRYKQKYEQAPAEYEQLLVFLRKVVEGAKQSVGDAPIIGVGIGIPALINRERNTLLNAGQPDWLGKNLVADLSRTIPYPIYLENNVRARAIGFMLFSKEELADPIAYYFISHGINCPIIVDDNIIYGQFSSAGEIGHTVVESNGPVCSYCGRRGCLNKVASDDAIVKRCKAAIAAGADTIIPSIVKDDNNLTLTDILKAQECSDLFANLIVNDALQYIGQNLASIINLISPGTVVVDALVTGSEQNREFLLDVINKVAYKMDQREVKIIFATRDEFDGAVGAAAIVVKKYLQN